MVFLGNCILRQSLRGFFPPFSFFRPAGEVNLIFNFLTLCQTQSLRSNFCINYMNISLQHFKTNFLKKRINLKFILEKAMKFQRRNRRIYNSSISLASAPGDGEQTTSRYCRFTPRKRDPVPIVPEAKWVLGSV